MPEQINPADAKSRAADFCDRQTGFAWKFKKDTHVEPGLKLVDDEKPEHYVLAPARNMPLDEYKGLLEKMGLKCTKYLKIKKNGVMEAIG